MRVGLVQLNSTDDMSANLRTAGDLIRGCARDGAYYIQTPETTHLMEMNRHKVLAKTFFEADDPGVACFSALASELGIWLHIGSLIIKVADDRLANRAFVFAPDGSIAARYDKIHLFDVDLDGGESYRESRLYDAGGTAVLVDSGQASIGLSVCYDVRFAYLYRMLAQAGAQILTVPRSLYKNLRVRHTGIHC